MTQSSTFDMTSAVPLPIPQSAIDLADRFAQQQPNSQKASQVRLNTLAVCVMQDYLQLMGIETSLTGDSWHPVTQLMADVADLDIEGVGRLECRPISGAVTPLATCPIPPEVWHDRMGYVVVQINEPQREAHLLGFIETVAAEELPLSQLQPPEALFDHLDRLTQPVTQPAAASPTTHPAANPPTSLSQWLQNRFQEGWETVESLLNPQDQLAFGFRSSAVLEPNLIRRARRIYVDLQAAEQPLVLVMELMPQPREITIRVQLYYEFSTNLPPGVQLAVLDNRDAVFLEAESRPGDRYLQLEFGAVPDEAFAVQVQSGESAVTEAFVV